MARCAPGPEAPDPPSGGGNRCSILGISDATADKHLQRVFDKLGVETRTAAVVAFFDLLGR